MPSPGPEAFRLAERYRLGLSDTPQRGTAGERLGKGTGASLEFQDRRAYVPGDDVRHLDWNAYARTDQLMVRLYREEILPHVDLLVDGSRSMRVDGEKAQTATDLATLILLVARASGFHARLVFLGDRVEPVDFIQLQSRGIEFEGTLPLAETLEQSLPMLRPGTIRVLLSDFLSPHRSAALVRGLAARAGGLTLIQVLGREDVEPPVGAALRLADVETDEMLDLVLDARTVERYKDRLRRLADGLEAECRRAGARFLSLTSGPDLGELCRDALARSGVLVPA